MPLLPHHDRPILIAGFGSIGRRHFRNLKAMGYEKFLFLRSGRSNIDVNEIAEHPASSDIAELLEQRPFAAVIANPTALHVNIARAVAEAGCHLFVEKPLSHQLEGCSELIEICRQNKLTTLVGCQFRFHPLFEQLKLILGEDRLGTCIGVRAESGDYLPGWHPWEDHRTSYASRGDLGGGVILTWIHPLDYLYDLLGSAKVVAAATRSVPSLNTSCEDWAEITLRFTSGVIGQVHLDYMQRPAVHQLTVWGDRGRAMLDFFEGTLAIVSPNGERELHRTPEGFDRNDMFLAETKHFIASVEAGTPTRIPLEDGLNILQLALDAKRLAG